MKEIEKGGAASGPALFLRSICHQTRAWTLVLVSPFWLYHYPLLGKSLNFPPSFLALSIQYPINLL
jgi:hypothetical protein